jgi:hypothetical protein
MPNALNPRAARAAGEPARGQMTEGHGDQERHPGHPERVREHETAHHARSRQGARRHRDPAERQQRAQEAGHRDRHPRHLVAERSAPPYSTTQVRAGIAMIPAMVIAQR